MPLPSDKPSVIRRSLRAHDPSCSGEPAGSFPGRDASFAPRNFKIPDPMRCRRSDEARCLGCGTGRAAWRTMSGPRWREDQGEDEDGDGGHPGGEDAQGNAEGRVVDALA